MTSAPPRRSISAVVRTDSLGIASSTSLPVRSRSARLSLNETSDSRDHARRQSYHQKAAFSSGDATTDLTAYYSFSRRRSSVVNEDQAGLSGFLEYRKLDGSWRPFLFQTIGYQLLVFRVHVTHQVQVMSTDVRDASDIALVDEGDANDTRLFRLGINGTVITLRAVSHHVAMYWIDGLLELRAGRLPDITHDRATIESEDDIFRQIDHMSQLREWRPPPSTASASWCGLFFPCLGRLCVDNDPTDTPSAAFATTHSPRPIAR